MKAKYLLLVFVFTICTNGYAQYGKKRPIYKLGFEVGPSIVKLKGNEYLDTYYKSTLGYAAGLSFQILVPKSSCSFKANIFYERKGAISDDIFYTNSQGHVTSTTHNSINLTYITVPVMLHLRTKGRVGLFVNVGAFVGFLLKDAATLGARDTIPEKTVDNTDKDNKLDGGFCLGAGLEIPIKEKGISSTGRSMDAAGRKTAGALEEQTLPTLRPSSNLRVSAATVLRHRGQTKDELPLAG